MNLRTIMAAGAAVASLALGAAPAQAATYLWTYTDASSTVLGSGAFSTDAADTNITAITGSAFGEAITALVPNPAAPGATSAYGFNYDNIFYGLAQPLNLYGVLFTTASGYVNIWQDYAGPGGSSMWRNNGSGYDQSVSGGLFTATAVAVPEPAAWALMILGFSLVGATARGRRLAVAA